MIDYECLTITIRKATRNTLQLQGERICKFLIIILLTLTLFSEFDRYTCIKYIKYQLS